MAEHGSENYLDNLLSSVNGGEGKSAAESEIPAQESGMGAFEQDLFGKSDSKKTMTAKKEEEFMREFESELLGEEIPDYIKNFENKNEKPKEAAKSRENLSESIDSLLDHMPQATAETETAPEPPAKSELDMAVDAFDEQHVEEHRAQGGNQPPLTPDGEVDLSGMSESDLMAMLSEDQDLADLGNMLEVDENGQPIEEGDPIGDFAEHEMDVQEKASRGEPEETGDEKKKPGFLAKLKRILFGDDDDEDEEKLSLKSGKGANASSLSAENDEILKELDAADKKAENKKAKKKKEKKPKPKKAKKAKKPKPKKPPKPKKEKPPKEPDNSPPLPKGPVVAIFVMAASLFGLVMLGTSLLGYQANISTAKSLDASGDYVAAFESMQGLKVKSGDEELYNKLHALASVTEKYDDYLVFDSYGKKDMALDSLVCAYGRYNLNKKYASAYECEAEFDDLRSKIVAALLGEYNMTEDEALKVYQSTDRKEYTLTLRTKLRELGMEEE
jgi:hypothetical protein